ncbi:MAG: hypothetical protein GWP05_03000 [Anaerolineaceae bacterium]|nr:hypothetical protein [Anaerolineaceae bacterium]
MSTARKRAALIGGSEFCENRYKAIQSLLWRVAGGLATVMVTVALAGAAHMSSKADLEEVRTVQTRTRELEKVMSTVRSQLAEIGAGQRYIRRDVAYIRKTLDEEKKR